MARTLIRQIDFSTPPKNVIINGGFDFWQRGTNVTALNGYGPDRFKGNSVSGDFSRQDAHPTFGNFSNLGFEYAVNAEQGAGGGVVMQRIESVFMKQFKIGEQVTFSFYAASASVNATGVMLGMETPDVIDNWSSKTRIILNPGGGTDFDGGIYLGDLNDRGDVWTNETHRFSYTFTVTEDMHRGLNLEISGDLRVTGTKGWLAHINVITGVMLASASYGEIPFQRAGRDYPEELQLCQRYYEKSYSLSIPPASITDTGITDDRTSGNVNYEGWDTFSVRKRGVPVCRIYSVATGAHNFVRDFDAGLDVGVSVTGSERSLNWSGNFGGTFRRIRYHWQADAEL